MERFNEALYHFQAAEQIYVPWRTVAESVRVHAPQSVAFCRDDSMVFHASCGGTRKGAQLLTAKDGSGLTQYCIGQIFLETGRAREAEAKFQQILSGRLCFTWH